MKSNTWHAFPITVARKCMKVIWSCKTPVHIEGAKRYLNLAYMGNKIDIEEYQRLNKLLSDAISNIGRSRV